MLPRPIPKRPLLEQNQIGLKLSGEEWITVHRSETIGIQCYPQHERLELTVGDGVNRNKTRISLNTLDKGAALTALLNWLRQGDQQKDPTDAALNGQWLELMEALHAYRGWLPASLLDTMPQYPFGAEELSYTDKLKPYETTMRRRIPVLLRTSTLSVLVIGNTLAAGLSILTDHTSRPTTG